MSELFVCFRYYRDDESQAYRADSMRILDGPRQ